MHQPHAARHGLREQVLHALDVDPPRQFRGRFALLQIAIAGAIEHRGELVLVEQLGQSVAVLGVASDDARPDQPEVLGLADADDLARILGAEIRHRIVARHAGHAGNQQRQRHFGGRINAADHGKETMNAE